MRLSRRMLKGYKTYLLGAFALFMVGVASFNVLSQRHPLWSPGSLPSRCQAKRNIVFLKMHKCAGSSVLNLLLRRAEGENLTLALPRNSANHLMGYPQTFSPQKHLLNYSQCGMRPNLMALHMRYNQTGIMEVMPSDAVYVTIMRRPTELFSSLFYYFNMNELYDADMSAFLRQPFFIQTIRNFRLHASMGFNQMTFDLGADGDEMLRGGGEKLDPRSAVSRFVESVDRGFHLVMIAERFTESLVLLRQLLCWDLDDVVVFKHNVRARHYPPPAPDVARILEEANGVDEALYSHFAAKLDRAVEAFGRGRMEAEVAALESRTAFWYRRCVGSVDLESRPGVYQYSPRKNVSRGESRMCQLLTMPEQTFVRRARERLFAICPQLVTPSVTKEEMTSPKVRGPR
ncbi:galactose-3-O-sulfotransferase 3-like [Amblyomma americanum]